MKRILLIHTGGTFGMMPMEPYRTLAPADIQKNILTYLPEIEKIANIDFEVAFNIDSANIQIHHWQTLAQIIYENYAEYDGFVIIHGTDAMVYTANALSFILQGLAKPVILTGSQRPLAQIRSDARSNLVNSLELATFDIPEVAIFFGTQLYRGNRTVKISSTHYEAFSSPNYPRLAEVGLDISISKNILTPGPSLKFYDNFDNRVLCIRFHPGLNIEFLESILATSIRAVVIEALGVGNLATEENSLIPWFEKMKKAGKLVVISSQSPYGRVDLNLYKGGEMIQKAGGISAYDMTPTATVVKLMWLLGQYKDDLRKVTESLLNPLAGEVTPVNNQK